MPFFAQPATEPRPSAQQRFMGDFRNHLAVRLAFSDYHEPPRMLGKAGGERPFGVRALGPNRLPPYRFALSRCRGQPQREQGAQRGLLTGIIFEEILGALRKHVADIDGFGQWPQRGIAAPDHAVPHVG